MKEEYDICKIIRQFSTINGLVIGDVMLDVYEYCLTSQSKLLKSEKEGKRAYKAQKLIRVLGGAGNVATNLAALGVKTSLIGITGNDEHYYSLRELCEKSNIDHVLIRDSERSTTIKTRLYIDDEYHLRRDDECTDKIDNETSATLLREILHKVSKVDFVILSDYNKGIFTEGLTKEIIKECRIQAKPVIVDFKPPNAKIFNGADVLSPNEHEAKELLPSFSLDNLRTCLENLFSILECKSVVVTLGENGLAGFDHNGFLHVKGIKVQERDAVGCGDTVRAGLALGLTLGLPLKGAVELANFAAALIVQKPNTSTITQSELIQFINGIQGKERV
jgi:D-beta-D-heptose 7-phosphate kinase/D-beta-D-heptose 1-phosphate adenosyltransferase